MREPAHVLGYIGHRGLKFAEQLAFRALRVLARDAQADRDGRDGLVDAVVQVARDAAAFVFLRARSAGRAGQPPFFLVGCTGAGSPLPPRFFTAPRIVTTWFFGPGTGPSMRIRLSSGRSFAIFRLSALTVSSP